MEFNLINPKSPGSKFNEYTDKIILFCNDLLGSKVEVEGPYQSIRLEMEAAGVSKNTYLRNVFSFLKNCGFVCYERGENIVYSEFFTDLGRDYIETIKSEKIIINDNEIENEKKQTVLKELQKIKSLLILEGIKNIINTKDCTYSLVFKDLIKYIFYYKSIDETEFAYLLYKQQRNELTDIKSISQVINQYRNKEIEIKFRTEKTKVIDSETDNSKKVPSFGYFLDILKSANVVYESEDKEKRYYLNEQTYVNSLNTFGGSL